MKLPGQFLKTKLLRRPVLRPDPVFIIGMHRSGTSALGGVLEPLGLTVGKTVMPPHAGQGNPKGFYENLPLTELHDKFLASINSSWRDLEPVREEHFRGAAARRFQKELPGLLIEEFGERRALIKDPRMCRLMPLWVPLIKEHFPRAGFILPIRHPVEVAYSLRQRDQLTLDHALKLWVVHVLEGEKNTRGFSRLFATYNQLMQAPVETVGRMAESLGLSADGIAAAVSRQIDSTLRHHAEPPWPDGEPCEGLTMSIHRALASGDAAQAEELDRLGQEYYGQMGRPV